MSGYLQTIKPEDILTTDILLLIRTTSSGQIEYETRILNLINTIGPLIHPEWGNISTTPTIDNQKDLLAQISIGV